MRAVRWGSLGLLGTQARKFPWKWRHFCKRSVPPLPCSGEQRDGVAARFGSEHIGEVGKEGAPLQPAGDRGGEEPLDRVLAALGLAAQGELAVDDRAAQATFGVVVGGLDAGDAGEGPQRRPALEQVLGEGAVAAVAGALARRLLEQRPELCLGRADALAEARAVSVPAALLPGGEQPPRDLKAGHAELLLGAEPLAVGGEVAHQMRPTELPPFRIEVVVSPPAVRAGDAGEVLAEQRLGLAAVATLGDAEERLLPAEHAPERAPLPGGAPAGLLDVDGRGGADLAEQVLVGLAGRRGRALQDRLDRASGDAGSEQLTHKLDRVTARDAVSHRQRDEGSAKTRTKGAGGRLGRQLGARRGAAGRAAQPLQPLLGEEHGGRRQLRDLMARGLAERRALCRAEDVAAAAARGPVVE